MSRKTIEAFNWFRATAGRGWRGHLLGVVQECRVTLQSSGWTSSAISPAHDSRGAVLVVDSVSEMALMIFEKMTRSEVVRSATF